MNDRFDDVLANGRADERLDETAELLWSSRPLPAPGFRGELGRLLCSAPILRPVHHLRLKALILAASGTLLLGTAGAGVAGKGPLAPSRAAQMPSNSATTTVR